MLALSCFLRPGLAHADTFDFTLSGGGLSSSGTFTTTADPGGSGAQLITGIAGTLNNASITGDPNTVSITGLAPINGDPSSLTFNTGLGSNGQPSSFNFTYDNLLFPGGSQAFDSNGLGFESADGIFYNIAFDGYANSLVYEAFNDSLSFDQRTFNIPDVSLSLTNTTAVTPEPSSLLLLGTGLLGMLWLVRRRLA